MSLDDNAVANSIKLICKYLNENDVDYVIVGGISVIAWGRTRTTEDIDFIIDHKILNITDFVVYLKNNNFSADEDDFKGFELKDHCTIFYKQGMFRIDIIGNYTLDNQISIDDAKAFKFQEINVKIDSPESLIAHKLLFGSQQDLEDAIAIYLRLKEKLDLDRLSIHAVRLKITDKLKKFLKDIKKVE